MNEFFEKLWCWAIRDEVGRLIILFKSPRLPAGAMQKGWTAECTTVARVFESLGVCVFTEGEIPKKHERWGGSEEEGVCCDPPRSLPPSSKLD